MRARSVEERTTAVTERRTNGHWKCWPRAVKSFLARDERETIRRLFREFGVKYPKEKRRLRVLHKIPWGVDFDVRNPAACPQAGTWNGPLEVFKFALKDATPDEIRDFLACYDPAWRN